MMGFRGLAAVLCCVLFQLALQAQNTPTYCNKLRFSLPFQIDPQEVYRLREAQLYESMDGRSNWRLVARIGPQDNQFPVQVPREGEYWYLLRVIETNGMANPAQLDRLPANHPLTRIVVDNTPPRIDFRELPGRGEQAQVNWNITDETLDISSIRLDYLNANNQWVPINIRQEARGEASLTVPGRGRVELRLSAMDMAKNQEAKTISLGGGSTASTAERENNRDNDGWDSPGGAGATRRSSSMDDTGTSSRESRYINKDTFSVNFNLEQVGPSGAHVEAFYLNDNQWTPCGSTKVTHEGPGKLEVKLPREGTFGIIMQVRSGFDNTASKPRPSASPEVWVCLDKTLPKVTDLQVLPGRGSNMGKVKILWRASDTHLASQPIRLEYRDLEDSDKNWQPIADNLENTGSFVWNTPSRGFRYQIRVSAIDKARNWGEAISQEVIVDVAQPKVRILDIDH
ncbi:MAG: hypothetical protein JNJ77_20990 [Planctomycetia bacterium]|nr:hypothetical protein [Planctomycetia bacterium]